MDYNDVERTDGSLDAGADNLSISDVDLEDVSGGGEIMDAFNVLNTIWVDFKKGVVDAWND